MSKKSNKRKDLWYKTWWGIIIIISIVLVLIILFSNSSSNHQSSQPTYSLTEIKQTAKTIPYDDLFRYTEKYVETPLVYEGEIIQVGGNSGDYYYRIDITKEISSWDTTTYKDTVYVTYKGTKRFLEKDIVKFYGVGKGVISYKSVLGAHINVPYIYALDVSLIQKASER